MKASLMLSFIAASVLLGCASGNQQSQVARQNGQLTPNYDQAYDNYLALGAQYLQMGRYDLAEPKLIRAIEIDSSQPEAWNVLAVMYEQKRDISAGFNAYQKLINSHPNYVLGYFNFATFLCKFERDSEAQALYQQMRTKGGDFATMSYIVEGNCAQKRGKTLQAENSYKQALAHDPYSSGALLPLAEIALERGDGQAALNYLKVVHTYVGYSAESAYLGILAARKVGDVRTEEDLMRMMRATYLNTEQAKSLGI